MFPQLGLLEMLIVMGVAVLLFGKRLPEVGRSLGKGIIEFKKGLGGVADEFESGGGVSSYSSSSYSSTNYSSPSNGYGQNSSRYDEPSRRDNVYTEESVPKFEIPGAPSRTSPVSTVPHEGQVPSD